MARILLQTFIFNQIHLSGKVERDDSDEYDKRDSDDEVFEEGHCQPRQHQAWRLRRSEND